MLKLTAILLMLIDHIGVTLIPDTSTLYWICRIIGRLAMPIFCYKLALGFIHTRHLPKYFCRILLMTLAAQIPFGWMCFGLFAPSLWFFSWNVGFTFLCGLGVLWCLDQLQRATPYRALCLIGIPTLLLLSNIGDYGVYGVLMIVLFYMHITYNLKFIETTGLLAILTILIYGIFTQSPSLCLLQLTALGSLLCIRFIPDQKLSFLSPTFFYTFYPVHMLLLALLRDIFMA